MNKGSSQSCLIFSLQQQETIFNSRLELSFGVIQYWWRDRIFQIEVNEPYPELNGGQNIRRTRGPVQFFRYINCVKRIKTTWNQLLKKITVLDNMFTLRILTVSCGAEMSSISTRCRSPSSWSLMSRARFIDRCWMKFSKHHWVE